MTMLMLMLFLAKGREVDLALRPIGGFLWDFELGVSLCSVAWGRASGACGAGWLPSWPCAHELCGSGCGTQASSSLPNGDAVLIV